MKVTHFKWNSVIFVSWWIWKDAFDLICAAFVFRKERWAGLLYVPDHDAQTDATGRPQGRNLGGAEDDRQAEERIHPGIWAPSQAHHVGRETY